MAPILSINHFFTQGDHMKNVLFLLAFLLMSFTTLAFSAEKELIGHPFKEQRILSVTNSMNSNKYFLSLLVSQTEEGEVLGFRGTTYTANDELVKLDTFTMDDMYKSATLYKLQGYDAVKVKLGLMGPLNLGLNYDTAGILYISYLTSIYSGNYESFKIMIEPSETTWESFLFPSHEFIDTCHMKIKNFLGNYYGVKSFKCAAD